jgi:hypothetical protein
MEPTTEGRFRVLGRPHGDDLLLIDVGSGDYDPTYVPAPGVDLAPGTLVDATLSWADGTPRFEARSVVRESRFRFYDGVTGLFEVARETWNDAAAAGEAMNARVTRNTDGDVNGVLYVFAEQTGARDLFEEFRTGVRPLEPLLERVNEGRGPAERSVFVVRPSEHPFVLVYIALRRDGVLDGAMRETYGDGDGRGDRDGRGDGDDGDDRGPSVPDADGGEATAGATERPEGGGAFDLTDRLDDADGQE